MDILDRLDSIGSLIALSALVLVPSFIFILLRREQRLRIELNRTRVRNMLTADETVRRELARDLHDDIAQELAAARLLCERSATGEDRELAKERAAAAALLLAECGKKVRGLSRRLRPPELENEGLVAAIQSLVSLIHQIQGVEIAFYYPESLPHFGLDTATHLYRIIHEALVNALKHASNHRVSIRIARLPKNDSILRIEIINEGQCSAKAAAIPGLGKGYGGLGIPGMQERARLIGARFSIQSADTRTRVAVDLPVTPATDSTKSDSSPEVFGQTQAQRV